MKDIHTYLISNSEHFSLQSNNCDTIESTFNIRLANRYRNQTSVRICLGPTNPASADLCVGPILVAKDPDEATDLNPSSGLSTLEAENVRLPVHRTDYFGFDFWLR